MQVIDIRQLLHLLILFCVDLLPAALAENLALSLSVPVCCGAMPAIVSDSGSL